MKAKWSSDVFAVAEEGGGSSEITKRLHHETNATFAVGKKNQSSNIIVSRFFSTLFFPSTFPERSYCSELKYSIIIWSRR